MCGCRVVMTALTRACDDDREACGKSCDDDREACGKSCDDDHMTRLHSAAKCQRPQTSPCDAHDNGCEAVIV
eukprot:351243-Chlamydomonas_euryale.AAC.4